jgi:hypothetical protein
MPVHILPDFAILDRRLSTARVSTAPVSPDVHALRQPLRWPLRCDGEGGSCMQYYRDNPLSQQTCQYSKPSERKWASRSSFFKARGWGTTLHVREVSDLSLDSSPPQQRPRDLPHVEHSRSTDRRKSCTINRPSIGNSPIKHRLEQLLGILSYGFGLYCDHPCATYLTRLDTTPPPPPPPHPCRIRTGNSADPGSSHRSEGPFDRHRHMYIGPTQQTGR